MKMKLSHTKIALSKMYIYLHFKMWTAKYKVKCGCHWVCGVHFICVKATAMATTFIKNPQHGMQWFLSSVQNLLLAPLNFLNDCLILVRKVNVSSICGSKLNFALNLYIFQRSKSWITLRIPTRLLQLSVLEDWLPACFTLAFNWKAWITTEFGSHIFLTFCNKAQFSVYHILS